MLQTILGKLYPISLFVTLYVLLFLFPVTSSDGPVTDLSGRAVQCYPEKPIAPTT